MAKLKIMLAALALLLAMQTQANAASKGRDTDGCALLASAIDAAVLHAAGLDETRSVLRTNQKPLRGGPITVGRPASCDDTTRVTTAAFSSALAKIGMPVGWGYTPPDSGDYCFSFYLSQCYPRLVSGYSASSASQLAFVSDAWKAVNVGVSVFMPYGASGNVSSFSPDRLKLSMLGAVANYVDVYRETTSLKQRERYNDY